jgi:O-antigen ligase
VLHRSVLDEDTLTYEDLPRMRALGVFSDPNDFGQLMLTVLPFVALLWRPRQMIPNTIRVVLPMAVVIFAMYLTRSRGAFVGLAVLVLLAFRKRLGTVLTGIALLSVLVALFVVAGSRELSFQEGSTVGRIQSWGEGLAMLKSNPLFGVGYGMFIDNNQSFYLTAHNSFVLCFSELGLFGYFFWLGLIVYTIDAVNNLIRSPATNPNSQNLQRYAEAIRLSLAVFLATAFFLSRTYIMTLYLTLAMALAAVLLRDSVEEPAPMPAPRQGLAFWTAGLEAASLVFIYVMVRIRTAV